LRLLTELIQNISLDDHIFDVSPISYTAHYGKSVHHLYVEIIGIDASLLLKQRHSPYSFGELSAMEKVDYLHHEASEVNKIKSDIASHTITSGVSKVSISATYLAS
jgi:hypothetical protein